VAREPYAALLNRLWVTNKTFFSVMYAVQMGKYREGDSGSSRFSDCFTPFHSPPPQCECHLSVCLSSCVPRKLLGSLSDFINAVYNTSSATGRSVPGGCEKYSSKIMGGLQMVGARGSVVG
jgi:hypothetical protein